MRCAIWYQTLKNGVQMVGQNVVLARNIRIVQFERCCKNCYINFSVLKADDEIKVRRRIFTFKTLIHV